MSVTKSTSRIRINQDLNLEDPRNLRDILAELKDPQNGVNPGPRSFFGLKFDRVFKGTDLIQWVTEKKGVSRDSAKKVGSVLLKERFISHASSDLLPFTEACFYRFTDKQIFVPDPQVNQNTGSVISSRGSMAKPDLGASVSKPSSPTQSESPSPPSSSKSGSEISNSQFLGSSSPSPQTENLFRSNEPIRPTSTSTPPYANRESLLSRARAESFYTVAEPQAQYLTPASPASSIPPLERKMTSASNIPFAALPSYTTNPSQISSSSSSNELLYTESSSALQKTTPITLEGLLRQLELIQYLDLFLSQHLDIETLSRLNQEDLKALGIPLGDCIKILDTLRGKRADITFSNITFEYGDIAIGRRIGGGNFGEVYEGLLFGTTPVALKQLAPDSSENSEKLFEDFKKEALILKSITHPNVLALLGLWSYGGHWIVTELLPLGDLKRLLKAKGSEFSLSDLLFISMETAAGMNCLSLKNIIHMDLSARNLLVKQENQKYSVRVADFGLAKHIQGEFTMKEGMKFPFKWTAPEIFLTSKITTKADVWSYGMTLWEIFTRGSDPFPNMSHEEVLKRWEDRGVPMQPEIGVPEAVYQGLMLPCWNYNKDQRPTFKELFDKIRQMNDLPVFKNSEGKTQFSSPMEISNDLLKKELEILREIDTLGLQAQRRIQTLENYILEIKKETNLKVQNLREQLKSTREQNVIYEFSKV